MALETGNYISALVKTNPLSSDNVSEGDDHLQLIKKILKQTFPVGTNEVGPGQAVQVLIAKATEPSIDTSASGHAARAMGLLWLNTGATPNVLNIRNEANDAWVTLPFSTETSNSVDINAGTIDGAVIGGATPAAVTATTVVANTSVNIASDGATVTGIKDEDNMASDSAVKLATQQSIKAYVDTQLTAEDLDISTDSGSIDIDLDSDTLAISGGEGIDTSASGTTVTIAAEDATSSNKGVASFSTDNFTVSSGAVTIKDAGVLNAELADMAANTVKVRNANSSGVPSDVALATTQVLIGDGTGFTAAALSGDTTMTNAGVVTVGKIQGTSVSATSPTNDQYLKYSSSSTEWQMVSIVGDDKLTTKGDLLAYNTVDSETRFAVGTNDYVLTADSSATNGFDWAAVTVADGTITNAKMADMAAGTVKVRDAGSSGVPSDVALTTTQILIGDGSGVTAAALSGDIAMTNAGVVTIANDAVEQAMIGDDAVGADQLASDAVVTASIVDDAVATAKVADNAVTLAKLADGTQGGTLYYGASGAPTQLAAGTSGYFLKTQGAGANPAWAEMVGGLSWQAVVTTGTTMVAGRGYFVNTTGSAFSMTLPASASLGDEVHVIDYAGTFDTNNCTVARNSHNILGAGSDLVVATERAAFKLVYVDATQGWLLTEL